MKKLHSIYLLLSLSYFLIFIDPIINFYISKQVQTWFLVPLFSFVYLVLILDKIKISNLGMICILYMLYLSICIVTFGILRNELSLLKNLLFILSILSFYLIVYQIGNRAQINTERYYLYLISFVCVFGLYQWLAYRYGLPFFNELIYRGRGLGDTRQITSLFSEPAFLGLFLCSATYYLLFVAYKLNLKVFSLVIVCVVLSQSVAGIFSVATLVSTYLFFMFFDRKSFYKIFLLFFVVIVAFLLAGPSINELELLTRLVSRVTNEVLSKGGVFGNIPGQEKGSGTIRVIGEINYLLFTIDKMPFFGFGVDYNPVFKLFGIERKMSLNAITEVVVRTGIMGFGFLIILIYVEKKYYPSKFRSAFVLYLVLISFSDGAIAKPEFYIPIAIIFGIERANVRSKRQLLKSTKVPYAV